MTSGHVGHDCTVGDDVIIAGLVAGHVQIGYKAFVSGCAVAHQFVRIGEFAMVGGAARVVSDAPPFMTLVERNYVTGPNVIGLRRAGFTSPERLELRQCFRLFWQSGLAKNQALARMADLVQTAPGRRLLEFLRAPTKRGIAASSRSARASTVFDD